MGLANLFRPKHKHSDPAVRAEAVDNLGAEDAKLLASVAREDRDAEVRRTAVAKIDDPVLLGELASADPDARVRGAARERAAAMWAAVAAREEGERHIDALDHLVALGEQRALTGLVGRAARPAVRVAALERIDDPRALAEIIRTAADQAIRVAALERIDDVEVLRAIATDEARKDVGCAAVDRIEPTEALEAIAARAKNRAVRSRAKRKLESARVEREPERVSEDKKQHAERVQLCRTVEALARGNQILEAAAEMERARRAWERLGGGGRRVEARFQRALKRYEARRRQALAAAAVRGKEGVDGEGDRPRRDGEGAAGAEEAAHAARAEAESDRDGGAAGAEEQRAGTEEQRSRAEERTRAKGAERREQAKENLSALADVVDELEARVATDRIKTGERALKRAQSAFSKLEPLPPGGERNRLVERYEEARQRLVIRVRELREAEEWKQWANVPKQEQLVERVRALLTDEDEANLLAKLKEAQAEWKRLGPGPRDKSQALWTEFKSVGDEVYERVVAYRARRSEAQAENLQRKQALCERAEELAELTDWDATAAEIKQLQAEWKQIGPVPRRQADAIWKRFRAACDRFFDRRKPHLDKQLGDQAENVAKKEAVCEAIEKLVESAEDWEQATDELRRLRREWRAIGRIPRREYATLGARFRAACDRFDAGRAEAREAERVRAKAAVDEAKAALEVRLEGGAGASATADAGSDAASDALSEIDAGWTAAPAPKPEPEQGAEQEKGLAALVFALRAAARKLGSVAWDEEAAARAEVDALVRRAIAADPQGFRDTELDPDASRARRQKLCERAEQLIPAEPERASADATPAEIADRLRAALAKNALGGSVRAKERSIPAVVAELREGWERLGPVPGPDGEALEDRFRSACERALAGAVDAAAGEGTPAAPPTEAAES